MNKISQSFSKIISSSGLLFIIMLLFVYFSVYLVKGERGLFRYVYLTDEVIQAREVSQKYAQEKPKAYFENTSHLHAQGMPPCIWQDKPRHHCPTEQFHQPLSRCHFPMSILSCTLL